MLRCHLPLLQTALVKVQLLLPIQLRRSAYAKRQEAGRPARIAVIHGEAEFLLQAVLVRDPLLWACEEWTNRPQACFFCFCLSVLQMY